MVPDHSHPCRDDSNHDLGTESEETDVTRREFSLRYDIDGGVDITSEGVDASGPCPVGGYKGLSEGFEELWKGKDSAAQRELESDEIDGKERRLLRGLHDG